VYIPFRDFEAVKYIVRDSHRLEGAPSPWIILESDRAGMEAVQGCESHYTTTVLRPLTVQ
jgi:hypothetical protein